MYHYCYRTTCILNNTYYIGVHSTEDLEDGYSGSGVIIKRSILKHGVENHITEIIKIVKSRTAAFSLEKKLVNKDTLADEFCLNLIEGGQDSYIEQGKIKALLDDAPPIKKRKVIKDSNGEFHYAT